MKQLLKQYLKQTLIIAGSFIFCFQIYAQRIEVKGKVLDAVSKKSIEGATVKINHTNFGTATDALGEFTIQVAKGNDIVISNLGYNSKTIKVSEGTGYLTILLNSTSQQLNEVVVTATGIKKESKKLGYSVQTVDATSLTQAREANPVNSLRGKAAGLTVNINQEIGHSADVIIRGENGERPLFVVDGVPITSDTYNINSDDVESYTVLKGPNAAALYGFQGRAGAIIINTKKGSKDKRGFSIVVNSSTQFNKGFIALPKYQDTYGPGDNGQYAYGGGGSSPANYRGLGAVGIGVNDYDYDVWGPQFRGQLIPQYDGEYTPGTTYTTTFANGDKYIGNVKPTPWLARGKDNLKKFLQAGLLTTNSVAIESSSEKADLRFSLGNTYQKGIVPNTQLNNFNATSSIVYRFNNKLTLNSYLNYSRQSSPNVPDVQYGPNSIIYDIIIWGGADWAMSDMRNYWQSGLAGIQQKYAEFYRYNNPYFMSYEWLRGHYQNNVYGYTSLNYKPTKDFEIQLRPSISTLDMFNNEKMPWSAGSYSNPNRLGNYGEDKRSRFESNIELQLKYNKKNILHLFDLNALVGANTRYMKFNYDYAQTNYLSVPGIYAFSNSLNPVTVYGYNAGLRVNSAYASVDLSFKKYLTASITGRLDKSSALPSNSNTYFYPSANIATVISDYVELPKVISFLKLRASYAESKSGGTSALFYGSSLGTGYSWATPYDGPTYEFGQTYSLSQYYVNGALTNGATFSTQTVSNSIQTSQRKATEFGVDMRFLNNRLGLDVTYYHYNNSGLITSQGISSASGYSSYKVNGDSYTNNGWEVSVNATPIKNQNGFSWNALANVSTFVKKWVKNSNSNNYVKNGSRVDTYYGNAFVRTPDGKLVVDAGSGVYLRYSDLGSKAQKIYGHSDPDFQWAFTNTLSYKSFSIRFQFDGLVGGLIEDYVRKKTLQGGRHIESATGALGVARPSDEANVAAYTADGVTLTGAAIQLDPLTGAITNMSSLTATKNTVKSQVQPYVTRLASIPDLDVISKTNVKLREVTLTYNIPNNLIKNTFIHSASFSLVGRNLLYFFPKKYKDLDIDQYTQDNGSGLQTPTMRSYGFNFNIIF